MYLSGIILKHTCQERLSEEETRNPEIRRSSFVNPFLHKFQSLNKIVYIASQRFKTGIWYFKEQIWHFVIE